MLLAGQLAAAPAMAQYQMSGYWLSRTQTCVSVDASGKCMGWIYTGSEDKSNQNPPRAGGSMCNKVHCVTPVVAEKTRMDHQWMVVCPKTGKMIPATSW